MRQILRCFDMKPHLRPSSNFKVTQGHHILLNSAQIAQIEEIFNMFDTDGGGYIDSRELDMALVAMGFQRKNANPKRQSNMDNTSQMIQTIAADGSVSLEEFTALMMGEISGRDSMDNLHSVFHVLSSTNESSGYDNLITLTKLQQACETFEV